MISFKKSEHKLLNQANEAFSNEKLCWDVWKILFKLFRMIERGKQYKYVSNIPSIQDRLQTMTAILFIFKTAHKNVT